MCQGPEKITNVHKEIHRYERFAVGFPSRSRSTSLQGSRARLPSRSRTRSPAPASNWLDGLYFHGAIIPSTTAGDNKIQVVVSSLAHVQQARRISAPGNTTQCTGCIMRSVGVEAVCGCLQGRRRLQSLALCPRLRNGDRKTLKHKEACGSKRKTCVGYTFTNFII